VETGEIIAYDKNEEVICKGVMKNGERWNGQFLNEDSYRYSSKKQILHFVNGETEGKQIHFYDREATQINFYNHIRNDKLEGEFAYFNKEGKQLAIGIYKDNEPWEGTFYDADRKTISTYEEGILDGDYMVLDRQGKIIYQANYHKGKIYGTVTSINLVNGKKQECEFMNGVAMNGSIFSKSEFSLSFISKQQLTEIQYFHRKDDSSSIPNHIKKYKDDKIIETIKNDNNGNTYHLFYKNEAPFEGVEMERDQMITYENGKKHGSFKSNYINYPFTLTGQYDEDQLDGKINFYDPETNDSTFCIYQKGIPIDGTVWSKDYTVSYKSGKKHGLEIEKTKSSIGDKITRTYKDGSLHGSTTYYKGDIKLRSGIYKNNQPDEGDFVQNATRKQFLPSYYSKGLESIYIISAYKNGKKDGIQNSYSQSDHKLLSSDEFKNNKLITKTDFITTANFKTESKGIFKKGKPHDGTFVTRKSKLLQIDFLEKGKLEKAIFIYKNGQDTLILKNQKPFDGKQTKLIEEDLFHHTYQKGMLTKTSFLKYEVNFLSNGFETTEFCEDCIIHQVAFSNQNKTSGKITFGKNQAKDFIRFSDEKIVEMNIQEEEYNRDIIFWKIENAKPTLKIPTLENKIAIKVESNFQLNMEMMYLNLIDIQSKLNSNIEVFYYLKNHKKPIASLKIINNKITHGIEIKEDDNGLFYLEKIVNGEKTLDLEGITLDKVLEVCEKN